MTSDTINGALQGQALRLESAELHAWGAAHELRVRDFKSAAQAAEAATGTSQELGRIGVEHAWGPTNRPLYGGPGMRREVTVAPGRRMDIAPDPNAPPLTPVRRDEWEVKLVKPKNLNNPRVRSEEIRDIARAQQMGPYGEVGWLSWKGFPQGMAQRLEAGGIVVVDAPALCRELSQPKTRLEEALLDYFMNGGAK
jgi:hypothetical protein